MICQELQYFVKNGDIMLMLMSTIKFMIIVHANKNKVQKCEIYVLLRCFYDFTDNSCSI